MSWQNHGWKWNRTGDSRYFQNGSSHAKGKGVHRFGRSSARGRRDEALERETPYETRMVIVGFEWSIHGSFETIISSNH